MELLASQIYLVNHSKNAIGEHGFEYCMKRNPCLQPKWRTFNLAIYVDVICPTARLKPPPNILCIR